MPKAEVIKTDLSGCRVSDLIAILEKMPAAMPVVIGHNGQTIKRVRMGVNHDGNIPCVQLDPEFTME